MNDISAIAYASFVRAKQVQIKLGNQWLAFEITGSTFGDTKSTRAIYERLVARGIAVAEPQPYILIETEPRTITIYH
jgi:hypothetical protein